MTRARGPRSPALARRALALLVASLVGCASGPHRERTVLAGNPARNLLILPLNVSAAMPDELEAASPAVWRELEVYLRAQGKELKTVKFADARQLWLESIREARAANPRAGYDEASRILVGKLAHYAEFDAVIAPSLFVRHAEVGARSASWDGVERPVEIEGADRLPEEIPLEGVAPAASLHVVVLDPQGEKLQEEIVGLDLLVAVRVERSRGSGDRSIALRYIPRADPFADRARVRDAIAKALAPFMPPLRASD